MVEARAAATAAALQRAQQALFVAGEELRDEEEHVRVRGVRCIIP